MSQSKEWSVVMNNYDYPDIQEKIINKNKSNTKFIAILVLSILASLIVAGIYLFTFVFCNLIKYNVMHPQSRNFMESIIGMLEDGSQFDGYANLNNNLNKKSIYESVSQNVVSIYVTENNNEATLSGSGIVISDQGYIITVPQVIEEYSENSIKVKSKDNQEYSTKLIGSDSSKNVAILKIDNFDYSQISFGNSSNIKPGDYVMSVGASNLDGTLNEGTIIKTSEKLDSASVVNYIEVNTEFQQKDIGGALVNNQGYIIGINLALISDSQSKNNYYVLPSSIAKSVADELITKYSTPGSRPRLGISAVEISDMQAQTYGIPQGIVIVSIEPESDLNNKNININDVITKVNSISVPSNKALFNELEKHAPGEEVTLTIYRAPTGTTSSQTFQVTVNLI